MPRDKDLKRLVRTRMQKTGESYTTARSRIVEGTPRKPSGQAASTPADAFPVSDLVPPDPIVAVPSGDPAAGSTDYAKIAGMSDEALLAKTGCDWGRWVYALDRHRAYELSHSEIAALVHQKYEIDGWWSQTVTVGYERIKGLRERGQRRNGEYEASKSRTYHVSVEELYDAWALKRLRRRWLTDTDPVVRTSTKPRTIRLGLEDGTTAALSFVAKGGAKSSVTVQHLNLVDRTASDRSKRLWGERLEALGELLKKR